MSHLPGNNTRHHLKELNANEVKPLNIFSVGGLRLQKRGAIDNVVKPRSFIIPTMSDEETTSSSQASSSTSSSSSAEETVHFEATAVKPKLEDFEILKVLGKGAYGKVYQVRKLRGIDDGKIYAMKAVNKSRIQSSRTDMRHTRTERDVLAKVDHPFLIKMHYAFETRNRLYFVQDYCRGGELFRLMETEKMVYEDEARFYLCEIICALEYLHSLNIVYRDLKTENIMLDSEGHIKLIDFGLSKIFDEDTTLTHTFCGTVEYMAPEVIIKSPGHGKPADWWSLGIFTFDLLTGRSPFHSNQGKKVTKERILKAKFNMPNYITHSAADFIHRLLRRNVDRRMGTAGGADDVKAHRFFSEIDWDMVEQRAYQPPRVPQINLGDATDVSQFDPRFTSRTPKESVCSGAKDEEGNEKTDVMFGNFDFVSEDCRETLDKISATIESSVVAMARLQSEVLDMHIRSPGD